MFEEAWKDTHRRGTISMQNMWPDTPEVRSTKGPTQERSHLHALNVERHLDKAMVSRNTKVSTLVRSPLHSSHVRIHLNTVDVWRGMKWLTQEKSPFHALNVERHLNKVMVSINMKVSKLRITCENTFKNSWFLKKHERTNTGEEPSMQNMC